MSTVTEIAKASSRFTCTYVAPFFTQHWRKNACLAFFAQSIALASDRHGVRVMQQLIK